MHEASGFLIAGAAASLICLGLLIASGVGLLKQRRVLGRYLGSVYAIVALAYHGASVYLQAHYSDSASQHSAFAPLAIVFFIYPLVLLALVNTTFRDDLVN